MTKHLTLSSYERFFPHCLFLRNRHQFSHPLFRIFKTLPIPNRKSWEAEILRECSPATMCHMSCVTCHLSHVWCCMSFFFIFFLQSDGASWWRVFYQWGLPCLVLYHPLHSSGIIKLLWCLIAISRKSIKLWQWTYSWLHRVCLIPWIQKQTTKQISLKQQKSNQEMFIRLKISSKVEKGYRIWKLNDAFGSVLRSRSKKERAHSIRLVLNSSLFSLLPAACLLPPWLAQLLKLALRSFGEIF